MSGSQSQEMKVPIRPAPPPPVNQKCPVKSGSDWENGWKNTSVVVQKKKPPPRPPPPKFPNKKTQPSRPGQLIAGLFQRKSNINAKSSNEVQVNGRVPGDGSNADGSRTTTNGLLLIDFNSPPSSPTFTARSSSDALSVNSFGSDGLTQGSGSSGNTSNVESGFEDDFDLFGSTGSRRGDGLQPRDPWSPPLKSTEKNSVNGKSWVTFPSPTSSKKTRTGLSAMPTIIRSKPEGHKVQTKVINCDTRSDAKALADVFESTRLGPSKPGLDDSIFEEDEDDGWSSESPPMPTCPPPPPPQVIDELLQSVEVRAEEEPNGIALYDYSGEQFGDLSFKKDDVIYLVRRIDENWLVGRKDGLEGSVPSNFLSIRVPPVGDEDVFVTALYAFQAETWDDLAFEEGSVVKVTHRIDQDWLYGECNGKSGQFPANFVDRVPSGLPTRRTV